LLGDLMDAQQFNASIESFNPITKIGWRGPYLSPGTPLIDVVAIPGALLIAADAAAQADAAAGMESMGL
ncbi:MAG: hypothetical protein AAF483_22235, partial [Planctomycetota bacterium]